MRPFVIDTNVVVAGLITRANDSPVRRLLDGLLAGTIPFVLSQDLLAEYRRVLLRPAIRKRQGRGRCRAAFGGHGTSGGPAFVVGSRELTPTAWSSVDSRQGERSLHGAGSSVRDTQEDRRQPERIVDDATRAA